MVGRHVTHARVRGQASVLEHPLPRLRQPGDPRTGQWPHRAYPGVHDRPAHDAYDVVLADGRGGAASCGCRRHPEGEARGVDRIRDQLAKGQHDAGEWGEVGVEHFLGRISPSPLALHVTSTALTRQKSSHQTAQSRFLSPAELRRVQDMAAEAGWRPCVLRSSVGGPV